MAVKEKTELYHEDKLGRPLAIGMYVAYCHSNGMHIGQITKFNPKMLKIKKLNTTATRWNTGEYNIYPHETIMIEGDHATLYVLKHS